MSRRRGGGGRHRARMVADLDSVMASPEAFKLDPNPPARQHELPSPAKPTTKPHPTALQVAGRTKRNFLLAGAGLGAAGATAYGAHRRRSSYVFKLYNPFTDETVEVGKAINTQLSALGHAAGASQLERKFVSTGRYGLAARAKRVQTQANARAGFGKAVRNTTSGTDVRFLPARTPSGQFVSHANKLKVVHIDPRRHVDSRLVQVRRGQRSRSGSSIGKSLDLGARPLAGRRLPEELGKSTSYGGARALEGLAARRGNLQNKVFRANARAVDGKKVSLPGARGGREMRALDERLGR